LTHAPFDLIVLSSASAKRFVEGAKGASPGREVHHSLPAMTRINHTVEQLTTADSYTVFDGLNTIRMTVTLPDWHQPFPIQVRMGAANPRKMEMIGLLHVCQTWYLNGPVMDQWTISTLNGPIRVPAGTLIETEELPEVWKAHSKPSSTSKREWFAYSNGRTDFC
jgi:hypothetical protein